MKPAYAACDTLNGGAVGAGQPTGTTEAIPVKAIASDHGGYAVTFAVPQLPLRLLHARSLFLIVASSSPPCELRWPALQAPGAGGLDPADIAAPATDTQMIALSHGHASQHNHAHKQAGTSPVVRSTRNPDPLFYDLVAAAASCPPGQVLFAGDSLPSDVTGDRAGMRAVLVRPGGLRPGERGQLPPAAPVIAHVRELPAVMEELA